MPNTGRSAERHPRQTQKQSPREQCQCDGQSRQNVVLDGSRLRTKKVQHVVSKKGYPQIMGTAIERRGGCCSHMASPMRGQDDLHSDFVQKNSATRSPICLITRTIVVAQVRSTPVLIGRFVAESLTNHARESEANLAVGSLPVSFQSWRRITPVVSAEKRPGD